MVIDGNRGGRFVLFPHDLHEDALGRDRSCTSCHHASLPFRRVSPCAACHRDMYSRSDIFDHASHVVSLKGNAGCARCHADAGAAKTRAGATPCGRCHETMLRRSSRVKPPEVFDGHTTGYVGVMHALCVTCHTERLKLDPEKYPADFAECRNCHRDTRGTPALRLQPYSGGADITPGNPPVR